MKKTTIIAETTSRVDKILAAQCPDLTRQKAQRAIEEGLVKINGVTTIKSNKTANEGAKITITISPEKESTLQPQDIPLDIIHEDKDYLIINKQAGLVVHPSPGHPDQTLVNAILYYLKGNKLSHEKDLIRPGIVHRLDQDTSGILVIAKNDKAHLHLAKQMEARTTEKKYTVLVKGIIDHKGIIEAPIGRNPIRRQDMSVNKEGKDAITEFSPLKVFANKNCTLLEITMRTGRTHQIRVHLASIGYPVIGDTKYGDKKTNQSFELLGLQRQFLHASQITFVNTKNKKVCYKAPLTKELDEMLTTLSSS
ncbi:MAG: hypothetical protein ACD_65C00195G0005 [uncultured bacterium]|nr:MAG: hypothetical protein ACD_65C00195G0005 [uncultured bacterium]KKT02822.1 MAG: RluA family pseudouridine synthase [Candidatus Peregrinibacteria bacterium GW2011_GWF2_43_17]KKT20434.1 MAG: Pseudouridine synthase [Candidatus Peregrinibacteria bacterium GW2011_GWA2_43_8]HAU39670.1 RluA family pseudouridine synthase [Candidatus Peregrinibacteria bacterium]